MKKFFIFVGLISLLFSSLNADDVYDNFKYKKSRIGSYMFGIVGGGNYSLETGEFLGQGGLNTNYLYDVTERVNLGAKAYLLFKGLEHPLLDEYTLEVYPYLGYKITPDINIYTGYGFGMWSTLENSFLVVGADYYLSDDFMIEFNYKMKTYDVFIETQNVFNINFIIPFNFY